MADKDDKFMGFHWTAAVFDRFKTALLYNPV